MDGNAEGFLRREKANAGRDRIANDKRLSDYWFYFIFSARLFNFGTQDHLVHANTKHASTDIEDLARDGGIEDK